MNETEDFMMKKVNVTPNDDLVLIQKLVREMPKNENIVVELAGGEYYIREPLVFGEEDSGTEKKVIWRAADGEKVLLHSSPKIDLSQCRKINETDELYKTIPCPEKTLVLDLKALNITGYDSNIHCFGWCSEYNASSHPSGGMAWPQLYFNGKPLTTARYPSSGYVKTAGDYDIKNGGYAVFNYEDDRIEKWADLSGVWVHGYFYFDWADCGVKIGSVDTTEKTIALANKINYGVRKGQRYYYLNVPDELTESGEWYNDIKNGKVYFIPPDGSIDADIRFVTAENRMLEFRNASHITFRNIDIAYTRTTAVDIKGGDSIRFEGCGFYNIGGRAIQIGIAGKLPFAVLGDSGVNHCIQSCDIKGTGLGGISISGGDRNTLEPVHIRVDNCDISDFSRMKKTYCFGVSLSTVGAVVSHNSFHDAPHSALLFHGNENIIEYNEFYRLLLESDDASAVYTGRDYATNGNTVRYNYFHDLGSDAQSRIGIFGTYADDNSAGAEIYGNVYEKVSCALLLHGGHDISFENNLIVGESGREYPWCLRFHRYGYPETLKDGGTHLTNLEKVPWKGDLWQKKYPHIAEYLTWEPDTEQNIPHYCKIKNNIIINHSGFDINFDAGKPELKNDISDNLILNNIDNRDIAGIIAQQANFEPLPMDRMGLYTDDLRWTEIK